jgi:prepilin-type N-terminal cleavage/methylation domain-containing protein
MQHLLTKKVTRQFGFTIIEVMIVLAIVGLILSIFFGAVPQLEASRRDSQRKSYIGRLVNAEDEYLKNSGRFPACDPGVRPCTAVVANDAINFIEKYMPEGSDPSTGDSYSSASTVNMSENTSACSNNHAVSTASGSTVYCYDGGDLEHNLKPKLGQIIIGVGHWCYATKPDGGNGPPLAGPDSDLARIVFVIGVEKGTYYCVDNYAS